MTASPLPGEAPPFIQSTWVTSDGYFYILRLEDMEVSHRKFYTGIKVLKAAWMRVLVHAFRLTSAAGTSTLLTRTGWAPPGALSTAAGLARGMTSRFT